MICVLEFTVNDVAALAPKVTPVAAARLVPVIVTVLPPEAGPWLGLTPFKEGTLVGVRRRANRQWLAHVRCSVAAPLFFVS